MKNTNLIYFSAQRCSKGIGTSKLDFASGVRSRPHRSFLILFLMPFLFLLTWPGVSQGQFLYTTNSDGITLTITGYTGSNGIVTIPDTIGGLSVTGIGDWAFYATSVTNVLIPDTVSSIGDGAFFDCISLTNVTIGSGVSHIGNWAFGFCLSLTSVIIPGNVTYLGGEAFYDCANLTSIYCQGNAPVIGSDVFYGDSATVYYLPGTKGWGLTFGGLPTVNLGLIYTINNGAITITGYNGPGGAVVIPSTINGLPVINIGNQAFFESTNVTSVTIPDTVTYIGTGPFLASRGAFANCTSLTNVTIGNGVTNIGFGAFSYCSSLTSVTIPNSVISIGGNAFAYCSGLTNLTFPSSVISIGGSAFTYCSNLTSVTIPDSVVNMGEYSFTECTGLTNFTIGSGVTSMGLLAGCTSLKAITVNTNNSVYSSLAGVLFDKNQTTLIEYPEGKTGPYAIPGSVTDVAAWAFVGCTSLTSVTIGNSVVSIEWEAFGACSSLTNVTIGASVTSIGDWTFDYCTSLTVITVDKNNPVYSSSAGVLFNKSQTTLVAYPEGGANSYTIPDSVTSIGVGALARANLRSVIIPNSVTNIGYDAFIVCSSLVSVYCQGNAPNLGSGAFWLDDTATVLFLPGTTGWGATFGGLATRNQGLIYTANNGTIAITAYTGSGGALVIPSTINGLPVTRIGDYAFQNNTSLTGISIPGSVTSIGEYAFYQCSGLTSVSIPDNVTILGDYAFYGCINLAGVYFLGDAPSADSSVFSGDANVTVYYLPGTTGWNTTFCGCPTMLGFPTVPYVYRSNGDGTVTITGYTGPGGAVTIPDTINGLPVVSIGDALLQNCPILVSVTVGNNVISIGADAFSECTNLTTVNIGSSVAIIGDWAFYSCSELTWLHFQGAAPILSTGIYTATAAFDGDNNATVYYLPGTTGWGSTFGGLPTAVWLPQMQRPAVNFSGQTNQFGFNIQWANNRTVVVEACTNLANPIWSPVSTNTIIGGLSYFGDPDWTNYPKRFYRIRSP